jgi:serine protease inhibitor
MNRQAKKALLFCIAATLTLAGRSSSAAESTQLQSNASGFALKFFRQEAKSSTGNVLVSPFSAYFALSMVMNGAGGKTLDQMAEALGTTGEQLDKLNQRNAECMKSLNDSKGVKIEVANAIYSDKFAPFKQSFVELCQSKYSAEAHSEDFSNPETVTVVNKWCSDKTHGKITEILQKLSKGEKMVLLNAIYFKGTWKEKFADNATQNDHFTTLSGDRTAVKMMHQRLQTSYFKGSNFSSVRLDYAGGKQTMYIFLPDSDLKLAAFQAQFTEENWNSWKKRFRAADVTLSLPRFKIDFKTDLKHSLESMGMENAFTTNADFSKMTSEKVFIGRALQKTYMDVNEEGTEAAAVTAVVMMRAATAARPATPVNFRVDRPFIVALVDEPTDQILFLGTITNPSTKP